MALFKWGAKTSNKKTEDKKKTDKTAAGTLKVAGGPKSVKKETKEIKEIKEAKKVETKEATEKKSMKDLYDKGAAVRGDKKEGGAAAAKRSGKHGNAYRVITRPLITEKAATLGADSKYAFVVGDQANKIEIAKAIDELYGIKPLSVNIIKVAGKKVRQGRTRGQRKNWKKAIVTLPKGKTINIYEGV